MTEPTLREALAVDLGQTHDHEIGIHDSFERVFAAQAEALIARGWTLAATPPALDRETLRTAFMDAFTALDGDIVNLTHERFEELRLLADCVAAAGDQP